MLILRKSISLLISFCLILEQSAFAQSIDLSAHFANFGRSIAQTDKFRPLHLRYLGYDNLSQDFKLLLDKGDTKKEDLENKAYIEENTQTLLKYFFIGLALPNDKFWVNLRPDSPDNILDPDLEQTDIGRIFLEADLQLKKDTASFTLPQTPEGKAYWDKLYKKAGELFGNVGNGRDRSLQIPTITRPWIVPNEIIIRESTDDAYIYKATLKVMLEEDYIRSQVTSYKSQVNLQEYSFKDSRLKELNGYSTQLIRETIIPKLTYEVNTSKRYAPLRQVYYSLILAQWFKARFRSPQSTVNSPQNNPYIKLIDSRDLTNLTCKEPYDKQTYFKQYQKSFKDGEYNLSEPVYTPYGQSIRRYMSGGIMIGPKEVGSAISTVIKSGRGVFLSWGRKLMPFIIAATVTFNSGVIDLYPKNVTLTNNIALGNNRAPEPAARLAFGRDNSVSSSLIEEDPSINKALPVPSAEATEDNINIIEQLKEEFKKATAADYPENFTIWDKIVKTLKGMVRSDNQEAFDALVELSEYTQGLTTSHPAIRALSELIENNFGIEFITERLIQRILNAASQSNNLDIVYEAFRLMEKLMLNSKARGKFSGMILGEFKKIVSETQDNEVKRIIAESMGAIVKKLKHSDILDIIEEIISVYKKISPLEFAKIFSEIAYNHPETLTAKHIRIIQAEALFKGLPLENKSQIFNKIIEPLFFIKRDPDMRDALLDIMQDFEDIPEYKYFLYYYRVYDPGRISQEEISNRFPHHAKIRDMLSQSNPWLQKLSWGKRVLIVLNTFDGMGDERIRLEFIPALQKFNPDLEIVVYTRRPWHDFLYHNYEVELRDIGDPNLMFEGKFDLIIHYSPRSREADIESSSDAEKRLNSFLEKKDKESIYLHINREYSGVLYLDDFKLSGITETPPKYSDENNYIFHYRLFAELGLPLPEAAVSAQAWKDGDINSSIKDIWEKIVSQNSEGKPIILLNGFAAIDSKSFNGDNDFREVLVKMIEKGAFVIVLPAQYDKEIANRFVEGLDDKLKKSVFIAPHADANPFLYSYLLLQAKAVVTAEGGIMHLAAGMGKPVVVFTFSKSSGNMRHWRPVNGDIKWVVNNSDYFNAPINKVDIENIGKIIQEIIGNSEGSLPVMAASSLVADAKGGVDFHALPIVTQQIKSLQSLSVSPLSINPNIDFDKEWTQIQQIFNAGIRPSVQRLVEFSAAAASHSAESQRLDDVIGLIADLLRWEEESQKLTPTNPALKGLLSALEA